MKILKKKVKTLKEQLEIQKDVYLQQKVDIS